MKNLAKKMLALLCAAMVLTVTVVPGLQAQAATVATIHTKSGEGYANTAVYVRKDASIKSAIVVTLAKKDAVTITGNKNGWLKVTATHKNKTYNGYMGAKYVNLTNTTSFNDVMKAVKAINAGSAGTSLRCKTAAATLKKYAAKLTGKTSASSFKTLAAAWIKSNKANKNDMRENINELESYMDTTDVLYLQMINGIKAACKTTTFNQVMTSVKAIQAGAAGTALRTKTAAAKLKAYAADINGKTSASSFKVLTAAWIKSHKANKKDLLQNVKELESYMDTTDVLYLQIINGMKAACK